MGADTVSGRQQDKLQLADSIIPAHKKNGWPECDAHFAGWAPIVSSRLTFSVVGEYAHKNSWTANLLDANGKRHIAHLQLRSIIDTPIFTKERKYSKICCYMVAQTNEAEQRRPGFSDKKELVIDESKSSSGDEPLSTVSEKNGMLSGYVCLFAKNDKVADGSSKLLAKIKSKIADLQSIPQISPRITDENAVKDFIKNVSEDIQAKLDKQDGHNLFIVQFEMHRSGELRLFVTKPGLPTYTKTELRNNREVEALNSHSALKNYLEENEKYVKVPAEEFLKLTTPQFLKYRLQRNVEYVFDFIRDTVHNHYHHNPQGDRLVGAYPTSPDNDCEWRLKTLQSLMDGVQRNRDARRGTELTNAQGILSYTKAFQNNIACILRAENKFNIFHENKKLKPHNLGHLEASLGVEIERRKNKKSAKKEMVLLATTILIASLATFLTLVTRKSYVEESNTLLDRMADNPILALVIVTFITLFTFIPVAFTLHEFAMDRVFKLTTTRMFSVPFNRFLSSHRVSATEVLRKLRVPHNIFSRIYIVIIGLLPIALLGIFSYKVGLFQWLLQGL